MELEEIEYTKSPLDWIGDVITVLLLLPVALVIAIFVFVYYVCKLPIWWLMRKLRGFKW